LPTEATLRLSALDDVYEQTKEQVTEKIKSITYATISTDLWTDSVGGNPYIDMSISYINNDWTKEVLNIKTSLMPHPHTSDKIANVIENTLADYQINKQKFFAVTDNGANIIKNINEMGIPRNSCIGHNLHLLLKTDGLYKIGPIKNVLEKIRNSSNNCVSEEKI
jgi:hypothetical protein